MRGVVVASFNVHGGVDGFGRPFDVVAACRALDADLLVLQECWTPAGGTPLAVEVGDALGYQVEELALTEARLSSPTTADTVPDAWGPVVRLRGPHGLRVGAPRPDGHRGVRAGGRRRTGHRPRPDGRVRHGTWGIALLSRVPLVSTTTFDLGQLRRDPARRGAIAVELEVDGRTLRVIGTHLSHLSHGSVVQLRTLRHLMARQTTPAVLLGDMNMWGPPLSALMPGWSRAVRGRTWPAWRPLAQLDHILVTSGVTLADAGVAAVPGSDHLPVRARVAPA